MQSETEQHLEALLILPHNRQSNQPGEVFKFIVLTASRGALVVLYRATWEIIVYIAWIWKWTPSQLPATAKLEI